MFELIILATLAFLFYRYRAVNIAFRILLFAFSAVGLFILLKVGFVGPFFEALISIPVSFCQGLFGLVYQLVK